MTTILTADIGGTNSRFGLFSVDDSGQIIKEGKSEWFATKQASSFAELLTQLKQSSLAVHPADVDKTVIAIAGAVEKGVRCNPTNIKWNIDVSNAKGDFGASNMAVINDFKAQAYAVRTQAMESAREILSGEPNPMGAVAVMGAGTALGTAALMPTGEEEFVVVPSEGGHVTISFLSDEEFAFLKYVRAQTGRMDIIGDIIVSGMGLQLMHKFLYNEDLQPAEIAKTFESNPDSRTLRWFARFFGRSCRNFVLDTLATGGLYIAGGVAAKTPALVTHESFAQEFLASETHSEVLSRIPIYLNSNEDSGLWGAALFGTLM